MRSRATIVAAALLGAVLSGCAGTDTGPDGVDTPGPAQIVDKWTSCAEDAPHAGAVLPAPPPPGGSASPVPDEPAAGRIDPAFTPVTAVLCGQQIRPGPAGGTEQVATERRADDIDSLLAALRLPDQRGDEEVACTLDLVIPPWVALLDQQGRWLRPHLPVDGCTKPRPEVRAALDGLRLTTVATRTVGQVVSPAAEAAGCEQQWSDMVWAEGADGRPEPPAPGAVPDAGPLRLCVYLVPAHERGGSKPAGDFAYGGALPPDRQANILRALATTRPAKPCGTPASRFAVLRQLDGSGAESYVELDGCRRVLVTPLGGGSRLGQGDAALTALLGPI
ncbi:hypothetical protein ADK66_06870 [Micromonospora sp. NRRL B-16802]|uniref:hypothetical protein n=1 Tax=Micromonospora sp. NRRL B-16802 TaxID=1415541 RepID=UPI0006C564A8|nr:hypothetical protein [Micromonospora sp. NRRL B-16802]KOX10889.1 hypothetical protein ADK66_06870 [Micromonospora sp. NRRL B-16802]